jgi:hypothetical protein
MGLFVNLSSNVSNWSKCKGWSVGHGKVAVDQEEDGHSEDEIPYEDQRWNVGSCRVVDHLGWLQLAKRLRLVDLWEDHQWDVRKFFPLMIQYARNVVGML